MKACPKLDTAGVMHGRAHDKGSDNNIIDKALSCLVNFVQPIESSQVADIRNIVRKNRERRRERPSKEDVAAQRIFDELLKRKWNDIQTMQGCSMLRLIVQQGMARLPRQDSIRIIIESNSSQEGHEVVVELLTRILESRTTIW